MKELRERIEPARVQVQGDSVVALYLFLRRYEEELDAAMLGVLNTVERELFGRLSVDEMEQLDDYYRERYGKG
ncbi:MAG: hypothetical protein ACLFUM_05315 [Spirochaetaceae bacterium]